MRQREREKEHVFCLFLFCLSCVHSHMRVGKGRRRKETGGQQQHQVHKRERGWRGKRKRDEGGKGGGGLTAPQEPQVLVEPWKPAPHLGHVLACMVELDRYMVSYLEKIYRERRR